MKRSKKCFLHDLTVWKPQKITYRGLSWKFVQLLIKYSRGEPNTHGAERLFYRTTSSLGSAIFYIAVASFLVLRKNISLGTAKHLFGKTFSSNFWLSPKQSYWRMTMRKRRKVPKRSTERRVCSTLLGYIKGRKAKLFLKRHVFVTVWSEFEHCFRQMIFCVGNRVECVLVCCRFPLNTLLVSFSTPCL